MGSLFGASAADSPSAIAPTTLLDLFGGIRQGVDATREDLLQQVSAYLVTAGSQAHWGREVVQEDPLVAQVLGAPKVHGAAHPGVNCDGCGMAPLTGPRFKSLTQVDYDLCQACRDKKQVKQSD